eukprot:8705010-Pyramimonas_sp.AAC.1
MLPSSCPVLDAPVTAGHHRSQVESSWDQLGTEFVTANCTTWNSLEKFLALTTAHAALCQEHKLISYEDRHKAEA